MPARDWDRMREILLKVEGNDLDEYGTGWVWARKSDFFKPGDEYQVELLEQAGLLESAGHATLTVRVPDRLRVTNRGHDYLDAIRDDGIWKKTKETVAQTGGNATVEIVKSLAMGYLKKKIEETSGVKL